MNSLTSDQVSHFRDQGYLVVRNLFDPASDLDPIIREYEGVLDSLARDLHAKGEISSPYADQPFSERVIRVYQESQRAHAQYFDFSLPKGNITEKTPIWVGPAVFSILRHQGLLDRIESLIGPEIYANPVQHVRLKLPESRGVHDANGKLIDGVTLWHQDNGVVLPEADATDTITVWFPLWDAPIESGCLELIPRSHVEGLRTHCPSPGGILIPDKLLDRPKSIPIPMKRGDALFMHRLTCHASLPNQSRSIRWSFDLRYNPIGAPTGRSIFPGFVARSRANPDSELHDAQVWAQSWYDARSKLARLPELQQRFNRWDAKAEACA